MTKKNNKTVLELHFENKAQFKNLLIEREKEAAISDFMASHFFHCLVLDPPYILRLEIKDPYIILCVENTEDRLQVNMPILDFRKIMKDYFQICEAYYSALSSLKPDQLEAIDLGRRSVHNEGAEILIAQIQKKIHIDFDTARRLFTIICVSMIGKNWRFN